MSDEILINITPPETRIAVVENGIPQELVIERTSQRGLVGNIYKGEICRVLPGMQAAFVDIGLDRAAFLHASDLGRSDQEMLGENGIDQYLREGQEVIVQVAKDPLGTKGARLTTEISVASRYQVYMPFASSLSGVSQRIECEEERERLRAILDRFRDEHKCGGFIARTVAEYAEERVLWTDMAILLKIWEVISEKLKTAKIKTLVNEDLPLSIRALRDFYREQVEKIRVDSRETYELLNEFAKDFMPEVDAIIEHYRGERPIFEIYNIEDEIQKALARKVNLKSGGYLIFDQTEAMTTIDVNTGAYVGVRSLEDTVFKTNLEATQTLARQIRLRNLGGIIIIDFIDMEDDEHKQRVLNELEKNLAKDHAKTSISEVSSLGLVEMSRKRTRESLERVLCETCGTCSGRGIVKSPVSVCLEIFREIVREVKQYNVQELMVLASNAVVETMLDEEAGGLLELETFLGVRVKFRVESEYTQEQYDVVLL